MNGESSNEKYEKVLLTCVVQLEEEDRSRRRDSIKGIFPTYNCGSLIKMMIGNDDKHFSYWHFTTLIWCHQNTSIFSKQVVL